MPQTALTAKENNQTQIASKTKTESIVAQTNVTITINAPRIHIKAETPNLILRSVTPEDVPTYQSIYANPQAMALFGNGKLNLHKDGASKAAGIIDFAQNELVDDPNSRCKRWAQGNPFSAMTIIEKNTGTAIGSIGIGCYKNDELAYFIDPQYWGKNYGSEAAIAMSKAILPAIVLSECATDIPKSIMATAHPDNQASCKILEKLGMTQDPSYTESVFGGEKYPRKKYEITVKELVADYVRIKSEKSNQQERKPKTVLPLYQLHKASSDREKPLNIINKGGYTLRNTESRKRRYSL